MTDQRVHPEADRRGGWSWAEPDRGEHFRRCSYCGSIHPEDLVAERQWVAEWSDPKYGWPHKFYIAVPNREPDALFVISSTRASSPPKQLLKDSTWTAVADLTPQQRASAERDRWLGSDEPQPPTYLAFGTRQTHFAKFYTIHLKDEDLSAEVKTAVEKGCGLQFEFHDDGRVAWRRSTFAPS